MKWLYWREPKSPRMEFGRYHLTEGVLSVEGDRVQLEQFVLNRS